MSLQHAWPSSLRLELEARRMHAVPRADGLGDVAAALVLSRLPAFFDLFVCAIAAVTVFPQAFFAGMGHAQALLFGAALAVAPLALAPLGAMLFRRVGRRHGRGVGLTAAHFLLGASTTAIGFLPGTGQLGAAAVVLLVLCRLAQAGAVGGIWSEPVPPGRFRAASRQMSAVSAVVGLLLAAGIFEALQRSVSASDFLAWGWRYPFIVAFMINIVALFANLRFLAGAPEMPRSDQPHPWLALVKDEEA
jgi:MFS family permease